MALRSLKGCLNRLFVLTYPGIFPKATKFCTSHPPWNDFNCKQSIASHLAPHEERMKKMLGVISFRIDEIKQVDIDVRCGDLLNTGAIALDFCVEHRVKVGGCDAVFELVERRAFELEDGVAAAQYKFWENWMRAGERR